MVILYTYRKYYIPLPFPIIPILSLNVSLKCRKCWLSYRRDCTCIRAQSVELSSPKRKQGGGEARGHPVMHDLHVRAARVPRGDE